jgi:transcriptional regulatory protein GAL4
VGNRCYSRVISTPPPTVEETLRLGTDLQIWHATLPDWFQPGHYPSRDYPWLNFAYQKLFWRYCNLRIILFRRPFLERALKGLPLASSQVGNASPATGLEVECAELCLQNATDSILAIHNFFSTRPANRLEWWYGL